MVCRLWSAAGARLQQQQLSRASGPTIAPRSEMEGQLRLLTAWPSNLAALCDQEIARRLQQRQGQLAELTRKRRGAVGGE